MIENNILGIILAGGKSSRFGEDKSTTKLGKKTLLDHTISKIENEFDGKVDISLAGKLSTWAVKIPVKGQEWVAAVKRGQDSMTTESINNSIRSFYRFWSKQ